MADMDVNSVLGGNFDNQAEVNPRGVDTQVEQLMARSGNCAYTRYNNSGYNTHSAEVTATWGFDGASEFQKPVRLSLKQMNSVEELVKDSKQNRLKELERKEKQEAKTVKTPKRRSSFAEQFEGGNPVPARDMPASWSPCL